MTKKAISDADARAYSAHLIEVKSNAVTLADIGDLFESYGIVGDVFELFGDVDAWRRLAIRLAIDTKKIRRPYAIQKKLGRRRSLDQVEREAYLWIEAERLGNASQAARNLSKQWAKRGYKVTAERLRQTHSRLKNQGLPPDTRRMIKFIKGESEKRRKL